MDKDAINPLQSPAFLLRRVGHWLHLRANETLEAGGISNTAEEVSILGVINSLNTPERMGVLADLLGREISTLTRQLDGLVKDGLVQRRTCPDDGRAVVIALTGKGRQLVKKATPMMLTLRKRTMSGISKGNAEVLTGSLAKMLENLQHDDKS